MNNKQYLCESCQNFYRFVIYGYGKAVDCLTNNYDYLKARKKQCRFYDKK